jgi:glutathione S-transferase
MQGQANHFLRYAPEKIPYAITRYINETERLYGVIEGRLSTSPSGYLVGDRLTIADIAHYGWLTSAGWSGVDIAKFPLIKEYLKRLEARPALKRGADVPNPSAVRELLADPQKAAEEAAKASQWIVVK